MIDSKRRDLAQVAIDELGHVGAMIAGSKSMYRDMHPSNVAVFNANVVAVADGVPVKIWYGDIDVTLSEASVRRLASRIGLDVHVLREMDGRFDMEDRPRIDRAVYSVTPDGRETAPRTKRDDSGALIHE